MASMTEQQLKQQLKTGELARVYLIYGEEAYLKQHYVSLMTGKLISPEMEAFNLHRFEGKEASVDEISDAVEAFPMMSDRTCVVVKDYPLDAVPAAQANKLDELLADPPETCVLIFWMDAVEVNVKQNAKWRTVLKKFDKAGVTISLGRKTHAELCRLLQSGASKRGCTFEPEAASYLVSVSGDDLNLLLQELEKLCFYAANKEITRRDIDQIAVKSLDATAFDLVREIVAGRAEKAYLFLDTLFAQRIEPVMIAGAMIAAYVDMYRAKIAAAAQGSALDAAKWFASYKNKEFRLRNAARDGSRLTVEQLRDCLEELNRMDLRLKSSAVEKRLVLEEAIVKLLCISGIRAT